MTATNHAITGVAIALAVHQPVLAIPLALAMHFVMDAIPHFDAGPDSPSLAKTVVFIDVSFAAILALCLSLILNDNVSAWLLLACAFACMAPDLVWGWRLYKLRDITKILSEPMSLFSKFHQKIQWSETHPGAYVEIFWFVGVLTLVILMR